MLLFGTLMMCDTLIESYFRILRKFHIPNTRNDCVLVILAYVTDVPTFNFTLSLNGTKVMVLSWVSI